MPVRLVEWQLPYTWWEGISIDENKVISLNLRDENNLIIYDSGDDEIYVDLQLPAWIKPNYAFPVGITTGRVLVADDWDVTGTIIVAKTTSWDVIKLLYGDDWTLWMDNGTWLYKQIYFKWDVDVIIQSIQTQIDALSGLGKFLSLWNGETWLPISFPLSTPYEYHTWDWFMINVVDNTTNYRPDWTEFDGTASTTVETSAIEIGDVYIYDGTAFLLQKNWWGWGSAVLFSQVLWDPYSNTNLASALNDKQDELIAGTNINIDSSTNTISATDTTYSAGAWLSLTWTTFSNTARFSPDSAGTQWQVLTKWASGYDWATVSGWDVVWPASSTDWHLAVFDWATGKIIKDWWAIPTAPVSSVNSQTWAVVLDADDISDSTTTNKFVTATDKTTWSGKQDALTLPATPTSWHLVTWGGDNKTLTDWWAIPTWVPAVWTNGQVLTVVSWAAAWANASWWDVQVSTQTGNVLTSWMSIRAGTETDYGNLGTRDSNTLYLTIE